MDLAEIIVILLTVIGTMICGIAAWFVSEFREMRKSVESLNENVAVVIARMESHEERLVKIEAKLS